MEVEEQNKINNNKLDESRVDETFDIEDAYNSIYQIGLNKNKLTEIKSRELFDRMNIENIKNNSKENSNY